MAGDLDGDVGRARGPRLLGAEPERQRGRAVGLGLDPRVDGAVLISPGDERVGAVGPAGGLGGEEGVEGVTGAGRLGNRRLHSRCRNDARSAGGEPELPYRRLGLPPRGSVVVATQQEGGADADREPQRGDCDQRGTACKHALPPPPVSSHLRRR